MRPTPRCLLLFATGFPAAALPVLVDPHLWTMWLVWVGLVMLAAGVDAVLAVAPDRIEMDVHVPAQLYVGAAEAVRFELGARTRGPALEVGLLLDLSANLVPQAEQPVRLPPQERVEVEVPLVALRRGVAVLECVWLRWTGPLGLMARHRRRVLDEEMPVLSDIRAVHGAALRFEREREVMVGARSVRFVGEGSEFDAMREYVPGLDPRSIHWRSTARHRKLICQDFRAERDHQVIMAFDTGHLMAEPLGGITKLDHAIHAGLIMAYTCLRSGDRVGLFAFDEKVRFFSEPRAGVRGFGRLQHSTARLDYTSAETNFTLGLAELSTRLKRRSLVVLLTDFVDTVTAELMLENAARLARRHLVVFVTLRDPHLEETVAAQPSSTGALYRSVVANDLVRERDLVLRRLTKLGIFTIDAPPEAVSTRLLNRYFAIKRRELI